LYVVQESGPGYDQDHFEFIVTYISYFRYKIIAGNGKNVQVGKGNVFVAFYNDEKDFFSKPQFKDASIKLAEPSVTSTIELK
jgi:hypothetical protein